MIVAPKTNLIGKLYILLTAVVAVAGFPLDERDDDDFLNSQQRRQLDVHHDLDNGVVERLEQDGVPDVHDAVLRADVEHSRVRRRAVDAERGPFKVGSLGQSQYLCTI